MTSSTNKKMLKLCFIGCGRIADTHARGIEKECKGLVEVTAVVDNYLPRAQKFAERFNINEEYIFTSLDIALKKNSEHTIFDAVDIMLPHNLHEQVALQCFEANVHVLLEKPMAPSLKECEHIIKVAKEKQKSDGVKFMIAEQSQYFANCMKAKELIVQDAIGAVYAVKSVYRDPVGNQWQQVLPGENNNKAWRLINNISGGGMVIDGGAHFIRPMRMFVPDADIESVVAVLGYLDPKFDGETLAFSCVRFSNGIIGRFEVIGSNGNWHQSDVIWSVEGTKGEITINGTGELRVYSKEHPNGEVIKYNRHHPHGMAIQDFAKYVLYEDHIPAATAEDSLGELKMAKAMYRSHETKRWEDIFSISENNISFDKLGQSRANL